MILKHIKLVKNNAE